MAVPKAEPQVAVSSFRESAKEFVSGFGKGVRDEGERIYRDAKELPERIAKTGRELAEDVKEGRKLRALAPIEAIGHAMQTASRDDVARLAHGVVDSARDFYQKPAKEIGESLGRATMSIASDAAISALTDGLGTVAGLRKAEKAAEAAEHVREVETAMRAVDGPMIHVGKQGKHIPSHSNFQPGRSILHADPEVLSKRAGTGEPIGLLKVGEAGSKERVVFGEAIGEYVDEAGRAVPTSVGIIHYSKDGIHIVPGRPK